MQGLHWFHPKVVRPQAIQLSFRREAEKRSNSTLKWLHQIFSTGNHVFIVCFVPTILVVFWHQLGEAFSFKIPRYFFSIRCKKTHRFLVDIQRNNQAYPTKLTTWNHHDPSTLMKPQPCHLGSDFFKFIPWGLCRMLSVGKGTDLDATNEERCPLAQILRGRHGHFWLVKKIRCNKTQ